MKSATNGRFNSTAPIVLIQANPALMTKSFRELGIDLSWKPSRNLFHLDRERDSNGTIRRKPPLPSGSRFAAVIAAKDGRQSPCVTKAMCIMFRFQMGCQLPDRKR